ncbi:hypothetical protein NQ314_018227 [Rhamnusium bicolor]|uniref:SHSP domain-containing protein n=1 Tax=Rhamnusium bicolor TaxID=1586634 RepID=A0AAV8WRH5_9CUCU|nr:hypothetical protein NQ314_018227 [Rhamnusium bicolor]
MALLLPLHEHQRLLSSLLGGGDQHLRLKLSDDDFLSPLIPRRVRRQVGSCPYTRSLSHKEKNSLAADDHKNFHVNIDVQQFAPEEISVKCVNDDTIVVECKHDEKQDEHGYISRHFLRRYKVPEGYDIKKCISKLSSDGVLTITAPKIDDIKTEIEIPITFTNQPSQIQNSAQETVSSAVQEDKKSNPKPGKKEAFKI